MPVINDHYANLNRRRAALVLAGFGPGDSVMKELDGERVAHWVGSAFHLGEAAVLTLTVAQLAVALLMMVGLGAVLFKYLPNVQQRWTHVLVASTVTTILWLVATLLFRVYVQHFGSYNKTYGAIGGVIALLTWMYYTMFVVLTGGELASELHHGSGAVDDQNKS